MTVRKSFVQRFELRRLGAGRGALQRWGPPGLVAAGFMVSALYVTTQSWIGSWDANFFVPAVITVLVLPLAVLFGACAAGVRAFAGERARGTLDALLLAPVSRRELVRGRLRASLRPYRLVAFLGLGMFLGLALWRVVEYPNEGLPILWVTLVWGAYYYSLLSLGAHLGLLCGARGGLRGSVVPELIGAIGSFAVVTAAELRLFISLAGLQRVFRRVFVWSWRSDTPYLYNFLWPSALEAAGFLLFSACHVAASIWIGRWVARRFDAWAMGKEG